MENSAFKLSRTRRAGAPEVNFFLVDRDKTTARRTKFDGLLVTGFPVVAIHNPNHGWNNISRFLQQDFIPDHDLQLPDSSVVVKRDIGNRGAGQERRLDPCHRSQASSPPDLPVNAKHVGGLLLRLEFEGDFAVRVMLTGIPTSLFLVFDRIQRDDQAINLIVQCRTHRFPFESDSLEIGDIHHLHTSQRDTRKICDHPCPLLALGLAPRRTHHVVGENRKITTGRLTRVLSHQRASAEVPRIRPLDTRRREPLENRARHNNFSTDFGSPTSPDGLGNRLDRLYIVSHILTDFSIATSRCFDELAIIVIQATCAAVDLGHDHDFAIAAIILLVPRHDFGGGGCLIKATHLLTVRHLFPIGRRGSDIVQDLNRLCDFRGRMVNLFQTLSQIFKLYNQIIEFSICDFGSPIVIRL